MKVGGLTDDQTFLVLLNLYFQKDLKKKMFGGQCFIFSIQNVAYHPERYIYIKISTEHGFVNMTLMFGGDFIYF